LSKGISIQSAWYKEQQVSCGTNFGFAYQVVDPGTVIIQLDKDPDTNLASVFKPVSEAPELICPYFVLKLQLVRK